MALSLIHLQVLPQLGLLVLLLHALPLLAFVDIFQGSLKVVEWFYSLWGQFPLPGGRLTELPSCPIQCLGTLLTLPVGGAQSGDPGVFLLERK